MKHLRRSHQLTFMSIDGYNLQASRHFGFAPLRLFADIETPKPSNGVLIQLSPQWHFSVHSS